MALESVKQNIFANAVSSGQTEATRGKKDVVTDPWVRASGAARRAGWADILTAKNNKPSDLPEDASREFTYDEGFDLT